MADRSIIVRLRAEVSEFVRGMQRAKQATEEVGTSAPKTQTALGRMVQSARDNREAWDRAGSTLTMVGGAITAVGAAALATGINYNQMQQSSRAALTTLLGSAEAANAQMDKLDDFARTSPFAKQVFIQAQQQMLGFGIEASKVIPYLDSIQNAVAATGGSNQDIAELTRIFSQVQAAAKITAVDLMQFGQRGVDAATLIGTQMGMTGAQVREAITAGTLDAGQALDALAAGMDARFGGAADNVKNTFAGAVDRVKAAWRDLASELATPLVDPNGGGALVDLLNQTADLARGFQNLPDPVKRATVALTGIVGTGTLAAGTFMLMLPRLLETLDAFKKLNVSLGDVSRTAAGATAAFVALTAAAAATDDLGKTNRTLEQWKATLLDLDNAGRVVTTFGGDVEKAFRRVNDPSLLEGVMNLGTLPAQWLGQSSTWEKVAADFEMIGEALASIYDDSPEVAAARFDELLRQTGGTTEELLALMPAYRERLQGVANEADIAAESQEGLGGAFDYTTEKIDAQVVSLQDMIDKQREAAGIVLDQREAQRRFEEAVAKANETIKENGAGLDITTEKGRANQAALDAIAASGWAMIDSARANGASQRDLQGIMQVTRDRFVGAATAAGMGADEANRLADELGMIPAYVGTKVTVDTRAAHADIDALRAKASASIQMRVDVNPNYSPAFSPNQIRRASGGSVFGPGTETSDSIPALLSHNEHVLSAREVRGMGGHGAVERLRELARKGAVPQYAFAAGGAVVARPMPSFAAGGAVSRTPSITVPDVVHLAPESVRQVAEAVVAGSHEVSTGVLAGAKRDSRGRSETKGMSW